MQWCFCKAALCMHAHIWPAQPANWDLAFFIPTSTVLRVRLCRQNVVMCKKHPETASELERRACWEAPVLCHGTKTASFTWALIWSYTLYCAILLTSLCPSAEWSRPWGEVVKVSKDWSPKLWAHLNYLHQLTLLKLFSKAVNPVRIFPRALRAEIHMAGSQAGNMHVDLFAKSFKPWKGDLVQIHW